MKPRIFAHRSNGSQHHPENTLKAIEWALEQPSIEWIELDVQYHARSGELLVFHDLDGTRLLHHPGLVAEQPLPLVKSLSLPGGNPILTVPEVLSCVKGRIGINWDIHTPHVAPILAPLIQAYLDQYPGAQVLLSSFWHAELLTLKQIAPEIPRGVLWAGRPLSITPFITSLNPLSIHLDAQFIDQSLIREAHALHLACYAYTVNQPLIMKRLLAWGLDGFFTDDPLLAAQICLP